MPVRPVPPETNWTPEGVQRAPTGRRLLDVLGSSLPYCVFLFVLLAAVLSLALSKLLPAFAVAEREKGRGDQRFVFTQAVPNGHQPFQPPSETQSNHRPFAMQTLATLLRRSFKRKYLFLRTTNIKKKEPEKKTDCFFERFFFSFFMQSSFAIKLVMQR